MFDEGIGLKKILEQKEVLSPSKVFVVSEFLFSLILCSHFYLLYIYIYIYIYIGLFYEDWYP